MGGSSPSVWVQSTLVTTSYSATPPENQIAEESEHSSSHILFSSTEYFQCTAYGYVMGEEI